MYKYIKRRWGDYNQQGYIYFVSKNYVRLPADKKQVIRELCSKCAGEYEKALFEFVTKDKSAVAICMKHNISQGTLYRITSKYYKLFPEVL